MLRGKNLSACIIVIFILSNCSVESLLTNNDEQSTSNTTNTNKNPNNLSASDNSGVFDLFSNNDNSETLLKVNRYIWKASLEVLNFLPIEGVDPFSGIITTGWGNPPGTDTLYRATVYVQDPSLDARSLKVALLKKSGPADAKTVRIVENAILSRARQLRLNDDKL